MLIKYNNYKIEKRSPESNKPKEYKVQINTKKADGNSKNI